MNRTRYTVSIQYLDGSSLTLRDVFADSEREAIELAKRKAVEFGLVDAPFSCTAQPNSAHSCACAVQVSGRADTLLKESLAAAGCFALSVLCGAMFGWAL